MTRNNFHDTKEFKSVFITGGSGGIGKAIAFELLRVNNGKMNIIITGRNPKKLEKTRNELESNLKEGKIIAQKIDVCEKDEMKKFIQTMDSQFELDLVIANAGIHPFEMDIEHYFVSAEATLNVNCQGVLNTILPIIPKMQDRKRGHIACVGSLAGYAPASTHSNYNATKAYLRFICDDLRPKLKLIGNIDLTYIAPGFVESGMCRPDPERFQAGIMKADEAARIIVNGLISNHSIIMFPSWFGNLIWAWGSLHPILGSLINDRLVTRKDAASSIGFFHEFDPDDEFGGEC